MNGKIEKRIGKKIMSEHFSTYHVTPCTGFCLCVGNKKWWEYNSGNRGRK